MNKPYIIGALVYESDDGKEKHYTNAVGQPDGSTRIILYSVKETVKGTATEILSDRTVKGSEWTNQS